MEKFVTKENYGLLTSVSSLTKVQKYLKTGKGKGLATFDLIVPKNNRKKPIIVSGIEDALTFVLNVNWPKEQLNFLEEQGFSKSLIQYLKKFKFAGDIWALPEGEKIGVNKPIIRVRSSMVEFELIKNFIINCIGWQTSLTSKFIQGNDFEVENNLAAARAKYIAGEKCTPNVLAGAAYNIPLCKTKPTKKAKKQKPELLLDVEFKKTNKKTNDPLLIHMIKKGKLIVLFPSLEQIRARVKKGKK